VTLGDLRLRRALKEFLGDPTMKFTTTAICVSLLTFAAGAHGQSITGAGSTFAAPIYGKWGEAAHAATGVSLNYQAIGSGAGLNQITNRTVDFGASDAPVPADKLESGHLLQFPTVMGGVVVIVNVPGLEANQLKLTGTLLAEIYMGKITKWNDPELVELNHGVNLPNLAIAPVYRADGSGTTYVFTDYLSLLSADWKSHVGAGTSIKWPAGAGARGSDGVAGTVHNIKGGIGYVESAFAVQNKLITTQLQNKAGKFVSPTMEAFTATAASADWSKVQNFAIDLNDQMGEGSWPIESATFVLLPTNPSNPAQSAAVMKFFDWGFTNGNDIATSLLYVPLPKTIQDAVRAAWKNGLKG
jgi:phosphate transport system substrate-binding protein